MSAVSNSVPIPGAAGGPEKKGFPVKVATAEDIWVAFKLEDGTVLKHKVMLLSVFRVENEFDNDGTPTYAAQMANFIMKDSTGYTGERATKKDKGDTDVAPGIPNT